MRTTDLDIYRHIYRQINMGSEKNSHLWITVAQRPSEAYLLASVVCQINDNVLQFAHLDSQVRRSPTLKSIIVGSIHGVPGMCEAPC